LPSSTRALSVIGEGLPAGYPPGLRAGGQKSRQPPASDTRALLSELVAACAPGPTSPGEALEYTFATLP